jgi:hypothetical protein
LKTEFGYFTKTMHVPDVEVEFQADLFISAFNDSGRVHRVFSMVRARRKVWIVHREYGASESTPEDAYIGVEESEVEFWLKFEEWLGSSLEDVGRVCVDITGMMRPHILTLVALMRARGIESCVFLYSDPVSYQSGHKTTFSKGPVEVVRQVEGYEGLHSVVASGRDVLILGTGYDVELISRTADFKSSADKVQLFGLPSLQMEMYRENRLQAARASESLGRQRGDGYLFAPANDPMATAEVLREWIRERRESGKIHNVYLAPLGTKAQVLGFGLYYLADCVNSPTSIIFPFRSGYDRETSSGLARIWSYEVPLSHL